MQVIKGNIWAYRSYETKSYKVESVPGKVWHTNPICITTCGVLDKDDRLVMGAGIARQAREKCIGLSEKLGQLVKKYGNLPFWIPEHNIISFPTKHHWKDYSDIELIRNSAYLIKMQADIINFKVVFSVWPGIGLGGLDKEMVRNEMEKVWDDDRFVIVEQE